MKIAPVIQNFQAKIQSTVEKARVPGRIVEKADQVLLGLSHSGSALLEQTLNRIESNPNDIVGRVGRSVLERAEEVRKQLVERKAEKESESQKSWIPEWLEEVKFVRKPSEVVAEKAAASTVAAEPAPQLSFDADVKAKKPAAKKPATKKKKKA